MYFHVNANDDCFPLFAGHGEDLPVVCFDASLARIIIVQNVNTRHISGLRFLIGNVDFFAVSYGLRKHLENPDTFCKIYNSLKLYRSCRDLLDLELKVVSLP